MIETNNDALSAGKTTQCIFCNTVLTKPIKGGPDLPTDKAKEHVLKSSFITELNHDATKVHINRMAGEEVIEKRSPFAQAYLAGEVCRDCNRGWIDTLDISVADIVLAAAKSPDAIISFSPAEALALSRWLLKMACTFESTDTKDRRFIPANIRSSLKTPGYLPPRFVSFYVKLDHQAHHIAPSIIDVWIDHVGQAPLAFTPETQSKRLKFGVQYDNVIFGCAYFDEPGVQFEGISGIHNQILCTPDTSLNVSNHPALEALLDGRTVTALSGTFISKYLVSITAIQPRFVMATI